MSITLTTELRAADAPAPRPQWLQLWRGDGTPGSAQWSDLTGPPGSADGDAYPTRSGDRSHPAAPSTVAVDDDAEVVLLLTPAMAAPRSEQVTRWFQPGTVAASVRGGVYSVRHTATGGASVMGARRPPSTAAAAGSGALVLYRDGASWRPALVQ